MNATIDRALWCPKPLRHLFVGDDYRTRCSKGHAPRIFRVDDAVWVALCAKHSVRCAGGMNASTLYRLGVEADMPAASRRLMWHDTKSVAAVLATATSLPPSVNPTDVAPASDVLIATLLKPSSWATFTLGKAPALVAMKGEHPIAIIGCTAPGAKVMRRATKG